MRKTRPRLLSAVSSSTLEAFYTFPRLTLCGLVYRNDPSAVASLLCPEERAIPQYGLPLVGVADQQTVSPGQPRGKDLTRILRTAITLEHRCYFYFYISTAPADKSESSPRQSCRHLAIVAPSARSACLSRGSHRQLATIMSMQASQHHAIVIAEQVASVFSVIGAFFIISTFLYDSKFRKPINRLVFYAAWGNLFANVGTLISRSGIELGVRTPLCQFQGLLIHWYGRCLRS